MTGRGGMSSPNNYSHLTPSTSPLPTTHSPGHASPTPASAPQGMNVLQPVHPAVTSTVDASPLLPNVQTNTTKSAETTPNRGGSGSRSPATDSPTGSDATGDMSPLTDLDEDSGEEMCMPIREQSPLSEQLWGLDMNLGYDPDSPL